MNVVYPGGAVAAILLATTCALAAGNSSGHDLDWLSASWCSTTGDELIEETWLPERGGMLLGMSRTTRAGRMVNFEFMRIVTADPAFIAQPNGGAPVTFKLTARGADWARFENPAHDFPTRVEYRRSGARLHAQIAGPGKGGKEQVISFEYQSCGRASGSGARDAG
jgi:hypothetical protein